MNMYLVHFAPSSLKILKSIVFITNYNMIKYKVNHWIILKIFF